MTVSTGGRVRLVYTPPTRSHRDGVVHRSTCEHISPDAQAAEQVDPAALTAAARLTCCSPRSFDVRTAIGAGTTTTAHTTKGSTMTDTAASTATEAPAAAPKAPAKKAAAKKAPATKKAATFNAAAPARTKVATFEVGDREKFKCKGACGKTLPVTKFPTVGVDGKRAVECRPDRDARTKAEKEARAAAKG